MSIVVLLFISESLTVKLTRLLQIICRRITGTCVFNKEDLLKQAERIGVNTLKAASLILENSIYIEQNYKSCFGMLMLQKRYGIPRLEAACGRALQGSRINYTMIKNILERGLDKQLCLLEQQSPLPTHENIRGKDNYQ